MTAVLASSNDDTPLQPRLDKHLVLSNISVEIIESPHGDAVADSTSTISWKQLF